jgi:hypothetical protein
MAKGTTMSDHESDEWAMAEHALIVDTAMVTIGYRGGVPMLLFAIDGECACGEGDDDAGIELLAFPLNPATYNVIANALMLCFESDTKTRARDN